MSRIVACLHNLEHPVLGLAGAALEAAGLELRHFDLRRGAELPRLAEVDAIVAFGGEQSVTEIASYPYLRAEAALLRDAVAASVPVLGVCLGGQLLAHALGAQVRRMDATQIGWRAVEPLPAALGDALFGGVEPAARFFHWNEDCFDLPAGAESLLTRPGPGVEAFRAGARAWGLQFHPEVDRAIIERWYAESPAELERTGVRLADARAADARNLPAGQRAARSLLDAFARVVLA